MRAEVTEVGLPYMAPMPRSLTTRGGETGERGVVFDEPRAAYARE